MRARVLTVSSFGEAPVISLGWSAAKPQDTDPSELNPRSGWHSTGRLSERSQYAIFSHDKEHIGRTGRFREAYHGVNVLQSAVSRGFFDEG